MAIELHHRGTGIGRVDSSDGAVRRGARYPSRRRVALVVPRRSLNEETGPLVGARSAPSSAGELIRWTLSAPLPNSAAVESITEVLVDQGLRGNQQDHAASG